MTSPRSHSPQDRDGSSALPRPAVTKQLHQWDLLLGAQSVWGPASSLVCVRKPRLLPLTPVSLVQTTASAGSSCGIPNLPFAHAPSKVMETQVVAEGSCTWLAGYVGEALGRASGGLGLRRRVAGFSALGLGALQTQHGSAPARLQQAPAPSPRWRHLGSPPPPAAHS